MLYCAGIKQLEQQRWKGVIMCIKAEYMYCIQAAWIWTHSSIDIITAAAWRDDVVMVDESMHFQWLGSNSGSIANDTLHSAQTPVECLKTGFLAAL